MYIYAAFGAQLKVKRLLLAISQNCQFYVQPQKAHNSSNKGTDVLSPFSRNWITTLQENEFWLNVYIAKGKSTVYIFEAFVY